MRRTAAVTALAAFVFSGAAALAVSHGNAAPAGGDAASAGWSIGTGMTGLSRATGSTDLIGNASTASFEAGGSVVEQSADGNFELEHGAGEPDTTLAAQTTGGSATPLRIGLADGQDVTALVVPAAADLSGDLQAWRNGDAARTAIDRLGRLRVNGIVLYPLLRNGREVLAALLPDGSAQVLRAAG